MVLFKGKQEFLKRGSSNLTFNAGSLSISFKDVSLGKHLRKREVHQMVS